MNAPPSFEPDLTPAEYADHVLRDAGRFAAVLDTADLGVDVPSCPGWTLSRLTEHTGQIHRWATFCVSEGRSPTADEAAALETYDPAAAAAWFRAGAAALAELLRHVDLRSPAWHPWPTEQVAGFWPRRQAHETAVHRWDAQHAVGTETPLDPVLASDGIDEYFSAMIPRVVTKPGRELPAGSLHVHCTDVDGEWLVWSDRDGYHVVREHQKGDAALRGPAGQLLLRLMGRGDGDDLSPLGDEGVLAGWLAVQGN
ncbi:MAG: maleylpyruvate isomerase family mycothiol-dependent enzyme [Ilumatobacter sp.]|uniref:maleylpyruvate isomerase family mycothiol-dependent enzyme n=1 Tax=Ilumatobacter sp. TaxID=1967498 RepID=UPI002637982A|nr:maleylpyruvate isomerase family mycothiol-dependent enzyme [Ilumatobacter sp.]MDJ0767674.1 maleylpyruvate isomerase family mycothiol-dependent enzyme [Ilumatobacter sp.]